MKNTWFYGSRILLAVIFIAILSMIGIGNPKVVPIFALFFVIVFALIFFLNKRSRESQREAKSGTIWGPILQILGLVLFIGVLSLLGLNHGVIGYIVWFLVISIVVAAIFLSVRKRQRHFELVNSNPARKGMLAIILGLLAVAVPVLIIVFGGALPVSPSNMVMALVLSLVGVVVFIALIWLALVMINKKGEQGGSRVVGYLLIILAAILPGILVIFVSKDSMAFAGAYLAALVALVLSYFALDLKYKLG